jgi:hypothetical protein
MRLTHWPLLFVLALGACEPSRSAARATAAEQVFRHGSWMYQVTAVMGGDPVAAAAQIGEWASVRGVTELYLALGPTGALLDDPGLPEFIAGLGAAGVSAEALIGDAAWTDPTSRERMRERIQSILDYNAAQTDGERFTALHLDIENWTTGTPCANQPPSCWLPDLTDTYRDALAMVDGSGMALAADINGTKLRSADLDSRQAVLDAAGRLLLMIYMQPFDRVERFGTECLDGVDPGSNEVMAAVRPVDFESPCDVLSTLDEYLSATPGYAGASAFNYAEYLALCP